VWGRYLLTPHSTWSLILDASFGISQSSPKAQLDCRPRQRSRLHWPEVSARYPGCNSPCGRHLWGHKQAIHRQQGSSGQYPCNLHHTREWGRTPQV